MKLHLGCGQKYFEGYVNIDYPLSEHSVQLTSVADEFANLLEMNYGPRTIDEVRLHHVFEHFDRAIALALLASWNSWLKPGGILHIETPNFGRTGIAALNPFLSWQKKMIAQRHIFGSQEAHWALHFEGYTTAIYKKLLPMFGFKIKTIKKNSWVGTYNIEVIAEKIQDISKQKAFFNASEYLKYYLVSSTESEQLLLKTWLQNFSDQLDKTYSAK
jgi:hypothetical protein